MFRAVRNGRKRHSSDQYAAAGRQHGVPDFLVEPPRKEPGGDPDKSPERNRECAQRCEHEHFQKWRHPRSGARPPISPCLRRKLRANRFMMFTLRPPAIIRLVRVETRLSNPGLLLRSRGAPEAFLGRPTHATRPSPSPWGHKAVSPEAAG